MVSVGAAAQPDVASLSAEGRVADERSGVHSPALSLVDRHRVTALQLALREPCLVDLDGPAVGGGQREAVGVEAGDGGSNAVQQSGGMLLEHMSASTRRS